MAYPWFSIVALALVGVLATAAVAAGVAVWRIHSLAVSYRGGLIAIVAIMGAAGIGWIVLVSPVYLD